MISQTDQVFPRSSNLRAAPVEAGCVPTVFLVDDEYFVRVGIRAALEEAGWRVVDFEACEAFLDSCRPGPGSCLILDAHLPGMGGLELVDRLRREFNHFPVVMISGSSDIATVVTAMKAGVEDFLEKPVLADTLIDTVRRVVLEGAARRQKGAETRLAASRIGLLTQRQLEVMNLVVAGCPSKVIAFQLGISQRTVETHRAAIMKRTMASSIPALARMVADSLSFLKANS